jgi:serine/threonine protein kinase
LSINTLKIDKKRINQYVIQKVLGRGSFAIVYLCVDKNTQMKYALKEMNKSVLRKKKVGKNKNAYDCVLEELKILKRLDHPNIIWLHEVIDDPS